MLQKKFKIFLFFTKQKKKEEKNLPHKKSVFSKCAVQMEQRNGNQKLPKLENKNMEEPERVLGKTLISAN